MVDQIYVNRKQTRLFTPHRLLFRTADRAYKRAIESSSGWIYPVLEAQTFSVLAIEAFCNVVGVQIIPRWKEDCDSASIITKLRLICDYIQIPFDEKEKPWATIREMVSFRNRVVHAKPEPLFTEEIMPRDEYEKRELDRPESRLKRQLTRGMARRSIDACEQVFKIIQSGLTPDQLCDISDGCFGHTQACDPPKGR